jgi:2-(3-amino-3-carboxypropyl)histidine synthase
MRTLFIEARSNIEINLLEEHINKLPRKVALATTAQHVHKIKNLKNQLEKAGKRVVLLKGRHSKHRGQILGCDAPKKVGADAVLFVGTGTFHPEAFGGTEVFVFDPVNKKFYKRGKEDFKRVSGKKRAALAKFLASEHVGVMVSLKRGQLNLKKALELKKRHKHKKFYFLVFDTLNPEELENFPFIQCFINAACPRISDESWKTGKTILNINEL